MTLLTRPGRLIGRQSECDTLMQLVSDARAGHSRVLVLRGEAGIGKSALLEFAVQAAAGFSVGRAVGVESEMQFPFAGLHQLCAPFLGGLNALPIPQQEALATAFGRRPGTPPDRFLVGLAVLTLLSEAAGVRPMVCVIDDAQWLDQASAQVLEFVARRVAAEPLGMVFAVREPQSEPILPTLPEMMVRGLNAGEAGILLQSAVSGSIDPRVRDGIVAESQGNPLALLELPRWQSAHDLVFGGSTGPNLRPLAQRLEQGFLVQAQPLSHPARQLLLTVAAEPVADLPLLWRAADRLGIDKDAAMEAEAAGLLQLSDRVRLRHPLVRSAVYRAASPAERRRVHRALAEVTDSRLDPDRRAWHMALAAVGPDETVAAELESSASRAMCRGGLAAAAAFLSQAAMLTPDPAARVRRCLDAARAKVNAGAFDDASALLLSAEERPLGEEELARIELLRAEISLAVDRGREALPLLLAAGRRLEPIDGRLAREAYLDALTAALFAGRLARGPGAREVAEAVLQAPVPDTRSKADALVEAIAVRFTDGYEAAAALSISAAEAFLADELTLDEGLRFAWLAAALSGSLWDDATWDVLTRRHLSMARQSGALSALPLALTTRAVPLVFMGHLAAAASLADETRLTLDITGSTLAPYGEIALLAVRGVPEQAAPVIRNYLDQAKSRGEGVGVNLTMWARAVLCNGTSRYREALDAAVEATLLPLELGPPQWALAELVEAAAHTGETAVARAALAQLSSMTRASGTDWALGIEASRRALLSEGGAAEDGYREGIERLDRTAVRLELARAQLLYGEWLRREGRRRDARLQLRTAYDSLSGMGVEAFANRARQELLATGETVQHRSAEVPAELTSQEARIAAQAVQGLTNSEIAASLYLSPRTVEWHMRKVFTKLGVSTRRELKRSLPDPYRIAV